jgi:hypothetical protein
MVNLRVPAAGRAIVILTEDFFGAARFATTAFFALDFAFADFFALAVDFFAFLAMTSSLKAGTFAQLGEIGK